MKQRIPKKIRRSLSKLPIVHQYLSRRRYSQYIKKLMETPPILVYQMGKVASSSVYLSIKDQYSGIVAHGHHVKKIESNAEVFRIYSQFKDKNFKIKIISLVREPISRNLSAFFENFERDVGISFKDSDYSAEELMEIFLSNYDHDIPHTWYDKNFKDQFGIDVYNYPLGNSNSIIIEESSVSLLLMKHDLEDSQKEHLIRDFIHLPAFRLKNANISEEKEYAVMYEEFKKLKLPKVYIDKMLSSKYAKHFYESDIPMLKEKYY